MHRQLCASALEERELAAALAVIETLDDDGYLRDDPAQTAAALSIAPPLSAQELEAGRRIVRTLEPAGVGAADLGDCLVLQLEAMDQSIRIAPSR